MREIDAIAARYGGYQPEWMDERRRCAVLVPFLERDGELHLLFERRSGGIRQAGETCFPGGGAEPGESDTACALRETEEELAIPPSEIQLLGQGDFICSQRGFLLRPLPGLVSPAGFAALRPSPAEVAAVYTVPLDFFRTTPPERHTYDLVPHVPEDFPYEAVGIPRDYPWARGRVEVPVWIWQGHVIWGMTARIVADLIAHL